MTSLSCPMNRSPPKPAATQASHRAPHSITHTSQRHSLPIHNTPTQQLQHITKPHANDADYYFSVNAFTDIISASNTIVILVIVSTTSSIIVTATK